MVMLGGTAGGGGGERRGEEGRGGERRGEEGRERGEGRGGEGEGEGCAVTWKYTRNTQLASLTRHKHHAIEHLTVNVHVVSSILLITFSCSTHKVHGNCH